MTNEELIEKIADEINETAEALADYIMDHKEDDLGSDPSDDYVEGWLEAVTTFQINLTGRAEENAVEVLKKQVGERV